MTEATTINQQAREVRQDTISIVEDLTRKAGEFELPKPPEALEHYREKLVENTYKVLVVGEAKRGKSTFINALIGEDVLPTNVRVTTSQVFSVSPAEREAYRLRFEDDSAQDIPREDLPSYGSQVLEDAGERPRLDQIIRWIEVDTPTIRFLPDGVSILDTPGLGALYAGHAQITHRFVPQADAVIFVLDSGQPVVQTEIEFIEAILEATPHIFFIQTKIDQFGEEQWRDTQRRNQEILEEKFGERLTDARVWPISSTLLLDAAAGGEDAEEDLEDAHQKELETALQAFLFRVAGWSRSAEAILVAERYRTTARSTLSQRLSSLTEEKGKLEEIKKQAEARRQQFERGWGQKGQKRKELVDDIRHAAGQGKKSIREALQLNGRIAAAQRDKIEAVGSPKEAEQLNETMPDEVVAAAMEEWRKVSTLAQKRCGELLGPFLEEADAVNAPGHPNEAGVTVRGRGMQEVENRLWDKSKASFRDLSVAGGLAYIVLTVTAAPLALAVAAVGGVVAAAVYGWRSAGKRQTRIAQEQLRRNLDQVLQQVRQRLLDVDIETGRDGLVDEYFASLERAMLEEVQKVAKQKEKEARAEYSRLMESGKLDEQQRQERIGQAERQLSEWDTTGKAIEGIGARLNELDKSPVAASAAG